MNPAIPIGEPRRAIRSSFIPAMTARSRPEDPVDIGDALFWSKLILAARVHPPLLLIYAACANAALPAARTPAGKTVADYQKYKRMF